MKSFFANSRLRKRKNEVSEIQPPPGLLPRAPRHRFIHCTAAAESAFVLTYHLRGCSVASKGERTSWWVWESSSYCDVFMGKRRNDAELCNNQVTCERIRPTRKQRTQPRSRREGLSSSPFVWVEQVSSEGCPEGPIIQVLLLRR